MLRFATIFAFLFATSVTCSLLRPERIHAQGANQKEDESPPKLARLRSLHKDRKWNELIEQCADDDFASWSEKSAKEAFILRGQAYAVLKKGKQAEADLKSALKLAPRDEFVLLSLGDVYRDLLGENEKALTTYRQVFEITGKHNGWVSIQSTLSIARVLTDQLKTDEALTALKIFGAMEGMAPVWRIKMLRAYGHIYAAQGKEAESLAAFREALQLEAP